MTKVIGDYTAAITIDGATHFLLIQPGSASTAYKKISRNVLLGVTGTPADISTAQALTNKTLDNTNTITLKDTLFTLQDDGDTTKQAKFQLSGITTGTTRTYTLPNASSTLADIATAQTFTNKTLTSPVISGGTIDNSTITVDAIGEHTAANGVTIDGLNIKDGALNTSNSVVTASITDSAVTPAKLQTGTGSGWTWQSYTPTTTNLTLTSGTLVGKYIQIGKTVIGRVTFTLGASSAVGTSPTFTLPITAANGYSAQNEIIGTAYFTDVGNTLYPGDVVINSTTVIGIFAINASTTYGGNIGITSAVPFTWGASDIIGLSFCYEAA